MLYLLPNLLADLETHTSQLPVSVDSAVSRLTHLIAESEKEGRRYLRRFSFPSPKTFREIPIHLLNEHSTPADKKALLEQILKGGKHMSRRFRKWGDEGDVFRVRGKPFRFVRVTRMKVGERNNHGKKSLSEARMND